MQNDLAHPDGALFVRDAAEKVDAIEGLQARFREVRAPVVRVVRSHRSDGWDVERVRAARFGAGRRFYIETTWGMQPIERLAPTPDEPLVRKRRLSGFMGTELDLLLRRARIECIALTGVSLHGSVRATATDAISLD